jgi:O-antigen/teichoic acid export membrane protein
VKKLWRSPSLRGAVVYGVSGLGFAGANLVLARVLPTEEYAVFTLVIALVNLGFALAPAGVDGLVHRRQLEAGPALLQRAMLPALLVSSAMVVLSAIAYRLSLTALLILFVSSFAGGGMLVAGAQFQSERRFGISLALTQSPNLALVVAALVVMFSSHRDARLPLLISALGFVLPALFGWYVLFHERVSKPARGSWFPWGEALSLAGINASGLLLVQLDRLVIPYVLPLHDLATYGVLAAIAGSLFRVLQMGVGYTLIPRLRAAADIIQRRRLIAHEAKLIGAVVVAGSIAIWFVTPLVENWFLLGKYHLGPSLLLATLFSGVAKIMNAFTKSMVTALATPTEVSLVNLFGWGSVALAIPAAVVGAQWGLAGVIYGVGLGWLLRALAAIFITARYCKVTASAPVTAR